MQHRAVLTRIQVPPLSFLLVVEEFARFLTFRTRPLDIGFVVQINVDLSMVQLQIHPFHIPRRLDPQNLSVQFSILHADIFARPLQLQSSSARAEDRAMLGSNPSADSGANTETGV